MKKTILVLLVMLVFIVNGWAITQLSDNTHILNTDIGNGIIAWCESPGCSVLVFYDGNSITRLSGTCDGVPSISETNIAWTGCDDQIYFYDTTTNDPNNIIQVTNGPNLKWSVRISKDMIFWNEIIVPDYDTRMLFATPCPSSCGNQPISDLTNDCRVNILDFMKMANEWLNDGIE